MRAEPCYNMRERDRTENQDGKKLHYISCLTAGSLIVLLINDNLLRTRETLVGSVFMHEINSPRVIFVFLKLGAVAFQGMG
jgi:hypothetical protein